MLKLKEKLKAFKQIAMKTKMKLINRLIIYVGGSYGFVDGWRIEQ